MRIPRFHLFELEDLLWFPATFRDLTTDYIHFVERIFGLHRPIVALLSEAVHTTLSRQIVDLCSGGGGPIPALQEALAANGLDVHLVLTDCFPNLSAFRHAESRSRGRISFLEEPVDARAIPRSLKGFRTIFNSFHHFRPPDALSILRDATEAGEPIGVFEIPERTLRTVLPLILTPLFVALATPFIRPFRWRRLFWTYLVPLVPMTCLWDGIVSQLRAYTVAELEDFTAELGPTPYTWRVGQVPIPSTPAHITYLIGYPRLRPDFRERPGHR